MTFRRWTQAEEDYLRANWQVLAIEDIAEAIKRTVNGCDQKRKELDLYYSRGITCRWTMNDELIMREMIAQGKTHQQIGKRTGHNRSTITKRAKECRVRAGQGPLQAMAMDLVMPQWANGEGVPIQTAHQYAERFAGPMAKLDALKKRRAEIVTCMIAHVGNLPKDSALNPHQREWLRLHDAYRDVRVAIDSIDRGAWPLREYAKDAPKNNNTPPTGFDRWTVDEVRYLRAMWTKRSDGWIAKAMERTVASVKRKRSRMKLLRG